jgi:hypothetical protein
MKVAVIVFADTESRCDFGRVGNALRTVREAEVITF